MKYENLKLKWREFTDVFRNEFHYVFHDGGVLLIVIGAILIYATAYSLAYKNEVLRDIPVAVVDESRTPTSRDLIRMFDATPNLLIAYKPTSLKEAQNLLYDRKINGIIVIPADYEKKLYRNEKINLSIYTDASYFLMYRQVFYDVTRSVLQSGLEVEWTRFVSSGAQSEQAKALSDPVVLTIKNLYNPYGGYATFIMPAIIMVIIQQTLLIGIGMVGGTWREKRLYQTLIPVGEKRMAVLPIVLGKSAVYMLISLFNLLYVLGVHYYFFGYPQNGTPQTLIAFLIPYVLACIFGGIALSTLFKYRENSLILLLFTSIPFLMLSGASLPRECIPDWLYAIGKIVPSSSGVDGFLRIQTMGATLSEVSKQVITLWVLTGAYFFLACLGMRSILRRIERKV